MKNKAFSRFYILSVIGVLIASFYPLYMGVRVLSDMLRYGMVFAESYPKYIIPYTPISLAVIVGVLLMPLLMRLAKRFSLPVGLGIALAVFFASELLLENLVIVSQTAKTTLESWQMYMCYVPPEGFNNLRDWAEVNILIGEYSPAFKLHFYVISVVLILAILNCFYGFGHMLQSGDRRRLKALILQSVSAVLFLGLCIFACFTAFFRTGSLLVSPVSAVLMCVFFVVFGVTAGIFTGSFLLGKEKRLSVVVPAAVGLVTTLIMYIGEMILLSGHLYHFGKGFFFDGLPGIVLAPIDILVVLLSGFLSGTIMKLISKK